MRTSRSGGSGGQNVNKRDTKVEVIHEPSGARGQASDERSQLQNKKLAFRRMVESQEFKLWVKKVVGSDAALIAATERELWPNKVKIEVRDENGNWVEVKKLPSVSTE